MLAKHSCMLRVTSDLVTIFIDMIIFQCFHNVGWPDKILFLYSTKVYFL